MTTTSSICDINYDILSLICGTIDDEYVCGRAYNRPSVLAFSETCKLLRSIAAPIIFSKLVIWDWDSFCETSQMMRTCENARRFTRTLQVAPIIERHLPPSVEMWIAAGQQATRFDRSLLPAVGRSSPRTNTPLHYGTRAPGVLEPKTAYMPLASIEDGPNINVDEHAIALVELLMSFDNLNELVFGLGKDPWARPPFENSLISALRIGQPNARVLSKLTRLDIEDTALFWTSICPNVRDLTLRLGYAADGTQLESWHTAESVWSMRVFGTAYCEPQGQVIHAWYSLQEPTAHMYGPALAKALPNTTSLELMDCRSNLEPLLDSLKDFTLLQHLHVHARLIDLGLGMRHPRRRCRRGESARWEGMNDAERAADLERRKPEIDRRNAEKQVALNLAKRLAVNKFLRLQSFKIGAQVAYDLTQLRSKENLEEVDRLTMITDVSLNELH